MDQFDKFPTLYLAPDKTQQSNLRALIQYIARNDIFDTLRTDRGSDFTSALAVSAAAFFRINHIVTPDVGETDDEVMEADRRWLALEVAVGGLEDRRVGVGGVGR